jgi:glycosyltransferase involved in cell wall biosynthesis
MTSVDVIVPVRNEEEAIPRFLTQVDELDLPDSITLGVMFIEDSSTDGTRPLLRRLSTERSDVTYYSLAQGFGQGAAVVFGLSRSEADAVIMMDGDGGHPPAVLPDMIARFLEGAEVVQCIRTKAVNRERYREWGSILFFNVARLLTGVELREQNVFFRLVSRKFAREILNKPRYWDYLRFPLPQRPQLQTIALDMEERTIGESKYGFWRLARLAISGLLSLIPPQRFGALLAVVLVVAAVLSWLRLWPLSLVLLAGGAWLVHLYRSLRRGDLLERLQVSECGGVAAKPGGPTVRRRPTSVD